MGRVSPETAADFVSVRPFAPLASVSRLVWHGDVDPEPPPWLIARLLPRQQVAIVGGQFSAGKTFVVVDFARSVMTGESFLGHEVEAPGGVLWLAAEGRNEVLARLEATYIHTTGQPASRQPFALQVEAVPTLTAADADARLSELVRDFSVGLGEKFDGSIRLAMIVIDTLGSAAGFQDENSASETQRVLNMLRRLSDATGALVLLIDHYGKAVETGIRGSSAKAAAADAILADKNPNGTIMNRRLVVEKLRQAQTGETIPFELVDVQVAQGTFVGAVAWKPSAASDTKQKQPKPAWSGTARVLRDAIERTMIGHGETLRPFGSDGPEVRAVPFNQVRAEFNAAYSADTPDAKRKQFRRHLDAAVGKGLVASREIAATV